MLLTYKVTYCIRKMRLYLCVTVLTHVVKLIGQQALFISTICMSQSTACHRALSGPYNSPLYLDYLIQN